MSTLKKKDGLSLEKCSEILNKNGNNYSPEEVKKISNFLDLLVEIDCKNFIKEQENEKSDSIHKSLHR